ncbi:MAG TPA: serine/threonine-protein kinase [Streptosporangiaceae bacterium]
MGEPQSGLMNGGEPLRRWDPERIGPYVILGRLGAGAMGQVYLGRSAAGRLVAVKTIKVELAEEAGFRTRFAQEVAAARRVSGVFTAAVVEADPEADLPWLATAYVPAPSLARLVAACGPMPLGSVRWLAAGCAEALVSIHSAGLVHRDLKPSNVLVAPDGPRVIDFGVARAAERIELTTSQGAVGTPAYMAPEQARDTKAASVASDVYSLGATLVFAATGHPPYLGEGPMDVLARLATEPPDLSGLSGELTDLVTACMQRVPRERPTSSAVLAQLGPFTEAPAGPAGEHSYLPEAAMALIGQYQRSPLLASGQLDPKSPSTPEHGDDATSASYTELPASYKPAPKRRPAGPAPTRPGRASWPAAWRQWLRTHMAWAGWAAVGAALIVGGVFLGSALSSSGTPVSGPPPAPPTVCGPDKSVGPALCMVDQSRGLASAAFTVQGSGFAPGVLVTFTVSEISPPPEETLFSVTSRYHATTRSDGTFRVAVRQLYASPLALGLVKVSAAGPAGGGTAQTEFMVLPDNPPPGAPPPAG